MDEWIIYTILAGLVISAIRQLTNFIKFIQKDNEKDKDHEK